MDHDSSLAGLMPASELILLRPEKREMLVRKPALHKLFWPLKEIPISGSLGLNCAPIQHILNRNVGVGRLKLFFFALIPLIMFIISTIIAFFQCPEASSLKCHDAIDKEPEILSIDGG